MTVVYRPGTNLDIQAIYLCEIKGHEIALDLEDLRPILNECETHVAVDGTKVVAFISLHVDEQERTAELTRCSIAEEGGTIHLWELLRKAPKMGRTADCKELTAVFNELDIEGRYRFFLQRLKFGGRAPGTVKAYGKHYDNYSYSLALPVK